MAVELEFRDGIEAVPDHVAILLRGVETHTMTKDEAVRASEDQMLRNHLDRAQRRLIAGHFREHPR